MRKIIPYKELDPLLDAAADPLEGFAEKAEALAEKLDSEKADLEIRDEAEWRRPESSRSRASFLEQFRADVDSIEHLDRQEEARLARRIEFARIRLERARRAHGLAGTAAEEPGMPGTSRAGSGGGIELTGKPLPRIVQRRALELHALRTEMVERNLYLVLINVERYAQSGGSRLDLVQEGCVSLFRAVDGFDWRRGLLFRTYAVHWLNQAFRNYLYNNGHTVRVPVYLQKALKHINQATIRIGKEKPTPKEIAENSELKESLVQAALTAARGSFSIDIDHSDGEDGSRLRDLLVDESNTGPYHPRVEDVSLEQGLESALSGLSEREALVVRMRFGVGYDREHTLAQVAERLGVSVERVRQIQVRALGKLDTPTLRRQLAPFLN